MVIFDKIKMPSALGGGERTAYIYLPKNYDVADERYPVLYMFDGHNLFFDSHATYGNSWRLAETLDSYSARLIVAAVECNHEGDMRLSEYSPYDFTFCGRKISGRGRRYLNWFVKDFKGAVDERFKTLPDRRNTFIGGSSMGGLMAIYALAKYGSYFSGAAALSPSLWVADGEILKTCENVNFRKGCALFTDYGTAEFANHAPQRKLFGEMYALLVEKGVAAEARVVEGGVHSELTWRKEVPFFLSALGII